MRGYSSETIRTRGRLLARFVEWCAERGISEPREVTKPILERFQRHLYYWRKADGTPLSFGSQAQRLVPVRVFFRWLAKENYILSNPASELELPRPERRLPAAVLSQEEAERLMAAPVLSEPLGLRDRAMPVSYTHLGEADLKHKVLAIAEEEGVRQAAYALKLLQRCV